MTITLNQAAVTGAGVSVVGRKFDTEEEVTNMSATPVLARSYATPAMRRARPHGVDRLVMRLSLAMLLWARHRADRGVLSPEQHTLQRETALAVERERRDAAVRIARVF